MRETMATRGAAAATLLLLVAAGALAAPRMPARVLTARYVAIGYDLGDRFLSETEAIGQPDRVLSEDRRALQAVRDVIEKWDRYVITNRASDAEILIAVRAGRRMQASGRRIVGRGEPSRTSGGSYAVELSSGGDMLSVYESSTGILRAPLWRAQSADGFSGPSPALVEQFKTDVEDATRKP